MNDESETDLSPSNGGMSEMHSPSIGKLAAALAKAQGEIEDALRDSENPYFGSSYADLASVWRACRKALSAHDLAVIQTTELRGEHLVLCTMLTHASGEWRIGYYPILPMKQTRTEGWVSSNDPQSLGSAFRYARRYTLEAIVGVAPAGADDDGESAMQRSAQERQPVTMRFGSAAGKTPDELNDKDLGWYLRALTRDINDPEKAKFQVFNQRTLDALTAEHTKRTSTPSGASVDSETGEVFDRMVPPETSDVAERAALIKAIKELSAGTKISKEDRDQAARTYLGDSGTLATADLSGLAGLRDWIKTRAGK